MNDSNHSKLTTKIIQNIGKCWGNQLGILCSACLPARTSQRFLALFLSLCSEGKTLDQVTSFKCVRREIFKKGLLITDRLRETSLPTFVLFFSIGYVKLTQGRRSPLEAPRMRQTNTGSLSLCQRRARCDAHQINRCRSSYLNLPEVLSLQL